MSPNKTNAKVISNLVLGCTRKGYNKTLRGVGRSMISDPSKIEVGDIENDCRHGIEPRYEEQRINNVHRCCNRCAGIDPIKMVKQKTLHGDKCP